MKPFSFKVPSNVERPYYLTAPVRNPGVLPFAEVKDGDLISRMRKAGGIAASALLVAKEASKPGVDYA